jgi:hypothetical protein
MVVFVVVRGAGSKEGESAMLEKKEIPLWSNYHHHHAGNEISFLLYSFLGAYTLKSTVNIAPCI